MRTRRWYIDTHMYSDLQTTAGRNRNGLQTARRHNARLVVRFYPKIVFELDFPRRSAQRMHIVFALGDTVEYCISIDL